MFHLKVLLYCLQVSIINFTVTQQGLEEQLLNVVVGHEMAKLEAQRLELVDEVLFHNFFFLQIFFEIQVLQVSRNKAAQKKLEDTLLMDLSTSTGNILDNAGEFCMQRNLCKHWFTSLIFKEIPIIYCPYQ
jgi:hypothetical protein